MNKFYQLPKWFQWAVAIMLMAITFGPAFLIMVYGTEQPLLYLLFIPFIPLSQFAGSPFNTLTGIYTYYSPMLLGYMANDQKIDLHSGWSFDYLFVMRKYKPGTQFRNRLLMYHLEGLLNLASRIEAKEIPDTVEIFGTSYFFNDRSLTRMGFEIVDPTLAYRINLYLNFIDLLWMYSLSKGKFSVPNLMHARKARITGAGLLENKDKIRAVYGRMLARSA
jgi:hypothetical protein